MFPRISSSSAGHSRSDWANDRLIAKAVSLPMSHTNETSSNIEKVAIRTGNSFSPMIFNSVLLSIEARILKHWRVGVIVKIRLVLIKAYLFHLLLRIFKSDFTRINTPRQLEPLFNFFPIRFKRD